MKSMIELPCRAASASQMTRRGVLMAAAALPLAAWPKPPSAPANRAGAAPNTVVEFHETTWAELLRSGPRPAAYVFTTSYCAACPDAFEKLKAFVAASRQKVELVVVLMDVQGSRALAHARHYVGADKLYAFDGFEPAIRQSVDPTWPNVTPYIVLLGRNGSVQRSIGPPETAALKKWLA